MIEWNINFKYSKRSDYLKKSFIFNRNRADSRNIFTNLFFSLSVIEFLPEIVSTFHEASFCQFFHRTKPGSLVFSDEITYEFYIFKRDKLTAVISIRNIQIDLMKNNIPRKRVISSFDD